MVRKKQIASPAKAMYLGYAALTGNDTTYCIYNDLPQNLERNEKVKNMKGGQSDETIIVSAALLHRGIKKSAIIEKEKSNEPDVFLPQTIITDRFRKGTIYGLRKKEKNLLLTRFFR